MNLLKFLMGARIYGAVVEEWNHGSKFLAGAVVYSCFSTVLYGLAWIVSNFIK